MALISGVMLFGCGTGGTDAGGVDLNEAETHRTDQENINPGSHVDQKDGPESPLSSSNIGGTVMTPSQSVVENVTRGEDLTKFSSALTQADMIKTLNGSGPFTIFAPTDEAFEAMSGGMSLGDLMKPENKERLKQLVQSHIVTGKVTSADLQNGSKLKTAGGQQLSVTNQNGQVMVNGATVEQADQESRNGVIHVVNKVLAPGS